MKSSGFYRIRLSRLTWDESVAAMEGDAIAAAIFRIRALLGMYPPMTYPDPSTAEVIDPASIDEPILRDKVLSLTREILPLGFELAYWERLPSLKGPDTVCAVLLSADRRMGAFAAASGVYVPGQAGTACGCWSWRPNGVLLGTTDQPQLLPIAPHVRDDRLPGQAFGVIVARHRTRLDGTELSIADAAELRARTTKAGENSLRYLLSRGLIVPLSREEVAQMRATAKPP